MLAEQKISGYLVYAFGEIILVVAGILIALAVNNWNQEAKNRKLGLDLLVRIHRDLVEDTVNFSAAISNNQILREEIKGVLAELYAGVESVEQVQGMTEVYDRALDLVFTPNDNTYQSMVSSGSVGLIRNPELKEQIIDLYSHYDQIETLLSSIGVWLVGVASALDTETDFLRFNQDVAELFTIPEMLGEKDFAFMNNPDDERFKKLVRAISAATWGQKAASGYYRELITRCAPVMEQIDRELASDR